MIYKKTILLLALAMGMTTYAQRVTGSVNSKTGEAIPFATLAVLNSNKGAVADTKGSFRLALTKGNYQIQISAVGFATQIKSIVLNDAEILNLDIVLTEKSESLDAVMVSAERREDALQRVPVAATVINAEQLKQGRVWSFSDVTGLAPSLFTVEHGGSTSSLFINIRGVMGLHSQTAVATYVDGVYQFEGFSVPLTFNNVERVEVLRGPQGTLYGRNAYGGAINIITKQPGNTAEGNASATLGNYEQQRYTASYRTPVIRDKLYLGVSGLFEQRSGVYTNTVTGDDFDRPQSIAGGLNLRYLATDALDVSVNARFERNEDYGSYSWVTSDSILFAEPYTVARDLRNIELRNNHSVSLNVNYAAAHFDLQSITAYQSYVRGFPEFLDVDFSATDLRKAQNDWDVDTFTQELKLSSKQNSDSPFAWTLGSYAFIAPNGINDNATITTSANGGSRSERFSRFDNKGIAFYGQAGYAMTDRLKATTGLRYDTENQRLLQRRRTVAPDGGISGEQPFTKFESDFGSFTPKIILNYQATENTMVYGQYARGFRTGGLNAFAPTLADVPFDPEYSDNYEVGIKNSFFGNRLKLNLTGFFLQQRDQQITVIEDAFFLTRNTGDVNNLGAELELEALPLKGLQVQWNASLSDAEYKELLIADRASGGNIDLSGNKPLFNPPFVSFTTLQYTRQFGDDFEAFIRGEHRYTGEYYLNFDNVIRQSPFNLYNARTGVRYKDFELAFWGKNLTEEKYRSWATGVFLLGTPRMYGVTLSAGF